MVSEEGKSVGGVVDLFAGIFRNMAGQCTRKACRGDVLRYSDAGYQEVTMKYLESDTRIRCVGVGKRGYWAWRSPVSK